MRIKNAIIRNITYTNICVVSLDAEFGVVGVVEVGSVGVIVSTVELDISICVVGGGRADVGAIVVVDEDNIIIVGTFVLVVGFFFFVVDLR